MSFAKDQSHSLFENLRPEEGSDTTHAVIATYSLDLIALIGLVLALGGKADEEFETGPIGLVDAFRNVQGKLKVICQKGRVVVPKRHHSILLLLDGMVRQVNPNERHASWHPKFALVRYCKDGEITWRFWVGSRNLTGSRDFEAGLLLVGKLGGKRGSVIADIHTLANDLLSDGDLPSVIRDELKVVRWQAPTGVKVQKVWWRQVGQVTPFLSKAIKSHRTLVISPFIDKHGLEEALAFSGGKIGLLTTSEAARGIKFDDQIDARSMESPEPLGQDLSEEWAEERKGDFQNDPATPGLHAKILMQQRGQAHRLFVGSANLTRRGLVGPNAELMAELEIADPQIANDLQLFFECQSKLAYGEKDSQKAETKKQQRLLDRDVGDLLAVQFSIELGPSGLVVKADGSLDEFLSRNTLLVRLFARPNVRKFWPSKARSISLSDGDLALKHRSSWLIFEAVSKADPQSRREWTQDVQFPELDPVERDRGAIAAYVGFGRFRNWLRAALEGIPPTEDEVWSDQPQSGKSTNSAAHIKDGFALEYVLGRWARNPLEFERRIPEISAMLEAFRGEMDGGDEIPGRKAAREELEKVAQFWGSVSRSIEAVYP